MMDKTLNTTPLLIAICFCSLINSASSLSCYQCIKEVSSTTPDVTVYRDVHSSDKLSSSCLDEASDCDDDEALKCASLTEIQGDTTRQIFDCVLKDEDEDDGEEDMCAKHGSNGDGECEKTVIKCEGDGCNAPLTCPSCEFLCSDTEDPAKKSCASEVCSQGVTQCYTRVVNGKISRGCTTSEQECQTGSCLQCDKADCSPSDMSSLCPIIVKCPTCELNISGKTMSDIADINLDVCKEPEICDDGINNCRVSVDEDKAEATVGCNDGKGDKNVVFDPTPDPISKLPEALKQVVNGTRTNLAASALLICSLLLLL